MLGGFVDKAPNARRAMDGIVVGTNHLVEGMEKASMRRLFVVAGSVSWTWRIIESMSETEGPSSFLARTEAWRRSGWNRRWNASDSWTCHFEMASSFRLGMTIADTGLI